MLIIGEVVVEDAIAVERFSCDLARCKGACCTMEGGRGAPLLDDERDLLARFLPVIRGRLSSRSLDVIDRSGAVEGSPGNFATTCVGHRDCVFVVYDGDVARCAIEAAWLAGEIPWRKPVSCHLFPLRYSDASNGAMARLRYEAIPQCAAGRERGEAGGPLLHEFVGDALVRRLGEEWYARLKAGVAGDGGNGAPEQGSLSC